MYLFLNLLHVVVHLKGDIYLYAVRRGKHIIAALSIHPSVRPSRYLVRQIT